MKTKSFHLLEKDKFVEDPDNEAKLEKYKTENLSKVISSIKNELDSIKSPTGE